MSGRPRRQDRRTAIRRSGLLLLAVACLGILTIYLRESEDGPIHSLQVDSASLMDPVQDIANEAIRPLRDSWDWTTGLASARNDVERLEEELQRTRQLVIDSRLSAEQLEELRRLETLDRSGLAGDDYRTLTASVQGHSFTNLYQRVRLNAGRADGVERSSPVVAPLSNGQGALVGVVTSVGRNHADVSLITDTDTAVGATTSASGRLPGLLRSTGTGELRLTRLPRDASVSVNDLVVTAGSLGADELLSLYPPDIPIGQVTDPGAIEGDTYTVIQVEPLVDPRSLRHMVIMIPESAIARRRASG